MRTLLVLRPSSQIDWAVVEAGVEKLARHVHKLAPHATLYIDLTTVSDFQPGKKREMDNRILQYIHRLQPLGAEGLQSLTVDR
jgi:hypothetical protein